MPRLVFPTQSARTAPWGSATNKTSWHWSCNASLTRRTPEQDGDGFVHEPAEGQEHGNARGQ
eukprot:11157221-Lingulodinium_polyedra.AAC.1